MEQATAPNYGIAKVFSDNVATISCIDFSKDGEFLVTSSEDESIRVYNALEGTSKQVVFSKKYGVSLVRWTHHTSNIIMASNNVWEHALRYLSLHDNQYLRQFNGHRDKVISLNMNPATDSFLSSSMDATVRLWDPRTELCQGLLHTPGPSVVSHDPSGQIFTIALKDSFKLYDIRSCDKGPFATFEILGKNSIIANSVEFSLDGKNILASYLDGGLRLIDAFDGTQIHMIQRPPTSERNLKFEATFSPDGSSIISGSQSGSLHVWSVRSGEKVAEWTGHQAPSQCVRWNPRKWMVASGCQHLAFWLPFENQKL
eukprot:TRINITY_DN10715_c0_g1_i1.p1 TRINITY_DN10715_c0_g1~~TRINITY_DN10715_c0_g1_i1.p1  ORF type:complete len:314 (+),score=56.91 TRINITY_DN10715_c0_g1_i1:55-996(+)